MSISDQETGTAEGEARDLASSPAIDDCRTAPNSLEGDWSPGGAIMTAHTTDVSTVSERVSLDENTPCDAFFRALSFLLQYEQGRDTANLHAALNEYRLLLQQVSVQHVDYLAFQTALCDALCERFDLLGDLGVIEEAVKVGEAVVFASHTAHHDHWHHLCCAARSLTLRFEITLQESDIQRAVELVEKANLLIVADPGNKANLLMVRGLAHRFYFEARSDALSLQEAIASFTSALGFLAEVDGNKSNCLIQLSYCHYLSSRALSNTQDLSESILYGRRGCDATPIGDPRLPRYLRTFAEALLWMGQARQNVQLLQDAIALSKQAVEGLVPGDRTAAVCFGSYAVGLNMRHVVLGDMADLNQSVSLHESALQMVEMHSQTYRARVHNCTVALVDRFRATGRLEDLDRSLYLLQEAMVDTLQTSRHYMTICRTLPVYYGMRYELLGELPDLLSAIKGLTEIAAMEPQEAPNLDNLAEVCYLLYLRTQEISHLHSALTYLQSAEVYHIRQDGLANHYSLSGKVLVSKAQLSGTSSDWEVAIQHLRQAPNFAPVGHYMRPEALRKLGIGLKQRFDALHNAEDIRESMSLLEATLGDAVTYQRAKVGASLGQAMAAYFLWSGNVASLESAVTNFKSAAEDSEGFISDRFHAAMSWAELAQRNRRGGSAYEGYKLSVLLLPQVAWMGFVKHARLQQLHQFATLAVDAAAAALEIRKPESAIELLESGRAVFWSQILQLRTDADDIRELAPSLAAELNEVGSALEMDIASSGGLEGERLHQRQRRLAERWEQLLGEVRNMDGFETFLRTPPYARLAAAAEEGPIVLFNASTSRCDALIMTPDARTFHCPLPAMNREYALKLSNFLRQVLRVPKDAQSAAILDRAISEVLDRLWSAVGAPVWSALKEEVYPNGVPRRIWFCPTGPFCLLPLHAAQPADGLGFPDLFICSYTATLSSLIRARGHNFGERRVRAPNMLAVSLPATPGYDPLQCAVEEMRMIYDSDLGETTAFLNGADATAASVCEEMLDNEWVHFSCHGSSNIGNPLETCLRLHDGPLTLSRISELRLPKADFAFLSACHTARALGSLPDEALHMAAGFQLAGFKSVIGTQWGIADKDAPEVAKVVYEHMTHEGDYDPRTAAEALQKAVNHLRRRGVATWRWVPFIHLGV